MALSTKRLINNIPREPDARNAKYVHVFATKNLGPASYLFTTVTKIPGDFTRKHKIWIKDLDAKDVMTSQQVWVSCDCDRFTYMWEHALHTVGASSIRFSNGDAPTKTNPRGHQAACKHVYRCLAHLAKQKRRTPPVKKVPTPTRNNKPVRDNKPTTKPTDKQKPSTPVNTKDRRGPAPLKTRR